MTDSVDRIQQLQARIDVLEQENSMLVEGAEDFLLLGHISEALNAKTDVSAMFSAVLEEIVLLKQVDLAAVCRSESDGCRVISSFDGRRERHCDGLLLGELRDKPATEDGTLLLHGAACQQLLGEQYPLITKILLVPFRVEVFADGYLLLAVDGRHGERLEQSRELFTRAVEILMVNVSNRLLFEKNLEANAALGREVSKKSKALEASEELFRKVIEQAFDGFYLHDVQGRFLQVNQRACESLGYSKDELLQMQISDLDREFSPEEVTRFLGDFDSAAFRQLRTTHRHKDGRLLPVEVSVSHVVLDDEDYFLSLVRDLTDQVEVEELQKKLDLLLDSLPDVVCMATPEGRVLYLNRAAKDVFGLDAVPREGICLNDLLPRQAAGLCAEERFAAAIKDGLWVGENQLQTASGEVMPTLQTIIAVKNTIGAVESVFCFERDLRELRRLEEQFMQAQKMEAIGTLVGGIAHDFNNLLAGIMGNLFMLLRQVEAEPQRKRLQTVQRMCQGAAGMISQLLVFARKDQVNISTLPLARFLVDFRKMYQVLLPEDIRIELREVAEDLAIMTDLTQFQQLMVNLLTNARDALEGHESPKIMISLEAFDADDEFMALHPTLKQPQLVRIEVSDNGCGMSEELQGKVFEPFFSTKKVDRGTGLGLAMVYGAVRRQSGVIDIHSTPGEGTSVLLYLPRAQADQGTAQSAEDTRLVPGRGELLVLADDDRFVRDSHAEALTQLGYRVLPVVDGEQAVDVFKNTPQVALVISDIVMPKLDGLSAGRQMRKINPELPLLFMTGYADRGEQLGELPAGAKILKKPVRIERLSQAVASMLQR